MALTITVSLVLITVLVSLGGFSNQRIIDDLIFYPPAITRRKQWYRFFSCGLIHADFGHLFFNMFSLYLFGRFVEEGFTERFGENGKWLFLLMYITALAVSLLPTYFAHRDNYHYRSLGASGAVSAVIFAGLMLRPTLELFIFFIPIPIPGFIFAPLYLLISFWLERRGRDNINHSAHIWGSIYGLAFVILMGRIYDYPVVQRCIDEVQAYLQVKGWIR